MADVMADPVALRQGDLREHNLVLLLRHLSRASTALSRAELATRTGLTRATVSALVDEMLRADLVAEVAPAPRAGAGRPSMGLTLSTSGPAGLGLEVNVDYLAACVVDLSGAVRHHAVVHADQRPRPPADAIGDLADLARDAAAVAAAAGLTITGAALAVPGLVQDGQIRLAPNLGWHDVTIPNPLAGFRGGRRQRSEPGRARRDGGQPGRTAELRLHLRRDRHRRRHRGQRPGRPRRARVSPARSVTWRCIRTGRPAAAVRAVAWSSTPDRTRSGPRPAGACPRAPGQRTSSRSPSPATCRW